MCSGLPRIGPRYSRKSSQKPLPLISFEECIIAGLTVSPFFLDINSEQGVNILNDTAELCYLTQILLRLFEDNRRELDDPRRFRVEILFSPGAEATPLHMHEQDRDSDPSRFDTAPLQMIGRDGLTCQELEDFFHAAIMEGDADEDEADKTTDTPSPAGTPASNSDTISEALLGAKDVTDDVVATDLAEEPSLSKIENAVNAEESKETPKQDVTDNTASKELEKRDKSLPISEKPPEANKIAEKKPSDATSDGAQDSDEDDGDDSKVIRNLERKFFWSTVAVGSFILAASCLVLALNLSGDSRRPRRYSTRRF